MIDIVKTWLEEDVIDIFVGYRMVEGHPLPHFFCKDNLEEVDELITGPARYPLERIVTKIMAENPNMRVGLLARDCTQRSLNVLHLWNQIDIDKVKTIDVNCCPSDLKEHGDCSYLEPEESGCIKKQIGLDKNIGIEDFETYDQKERFDRWIYEFQKCVKCYGCRNICPVCFCKECSLEHPDLVEPGGLPPEIPIFHLVRAVHMAGRCIDCGLCEDACPAEIPLRLLYRKINRIVKDVFEYETGTREELSPFSILGEDVSLEIIPIRMT